MATETKCLVSLATHGGYRADYLHHGEWRRVFFRTRQELAARLAVDRVSGNDIELMVTEFEKVEIEEPAEKTDPEDAPLWMLYLRAVAWTGLVAAPFVTGIIYLQWRMGVWK